MKKKWSKKYKRSIDCNNPKGFSQKAHCAGRKKRESVMTSLNEDKLQKKAFDIVKDLNKMYPTYNVKFLGAFNKVVKNLKSMLPGVSNLNLGKIALDYHNYRKGDMGRKIPTIKKMAHTMRKVGVKEQKMSDKQQYDYLLYMKKYKPDIWRDLQGNKKVKKIMKKFESVNENKLIGMAVSIAKKMSGNMTGAVKAIEKLSKGLSKNKDVEKALRMANEGLGENTDMTKAIDKGTKITFSKRLPTGYAYLAGKTFYVSKKGINTYNMLPVGSYNEKDTKTLDAPTLLKLVKNRNISKVITSRGKNITKLRLAHKEGLDDLKALPKDLKKSIKKNRNEVFFESSTEDGMVTNHIYYEIDGKGYGYTLEFVNELNEAEYQGRKVKLGKIMQGDQKKFKVYVKNPKGNVVKVNFGQGGDAKGGTMRIRKSNAAARKSFRARHNCDNPGPRHKARYWSCRKW